MGGNLLGIFVREIVAGSPAAENLSTPNGEEGADVTLNVGDQVSSFDCLLVCYSMFACLFTFLLGISTRKEPTLR